MPARRRRDAAALLVAFALIAAACSGGDGEDAAAPSTTQAPETTTTTEAPATTTTTTEAPPAITEDRAYYILPPGNYGGFPELTDESLDQLPLYDGLTPLRDDIDEADLDELFLAMDFEPVGPTQVEDVGRGDVTVTYDDFGVAHIAADTREGLAFAAGWVTARDRGFFMQVGRGPARAAIADIPGVNAFDLVLSATPYVPSPEVEALVDAQVQLLIDTYGDEGQEIVDDAQAYADGLTAYWQANDIDLAPPRSTT